ncbi:hypothetical protein LJC64_02350 [Ruminococcaceae bacterium OttesenSCG-928-A11]|nr:hypothetical protein [Ruminococcaceae bacterium OttesenSCG-928-A11]
MKWYVLQVATGQEVKVRNALRRRRLPVKVVREQCQIHRKGKWQTKLKTLIPGYVFLGADAEDGSSLTDETYYTATSTPGVIRFLGTPPQPITDAEAAHLALLAPTDEPLRPSTVRRADGAVLDGPLVQLREHITKIDRHRRRVKVSIPMLGEAKAFEMSILLEDGGDGQGGEEDDPGGQGKGT